MRAWPLFLLAFACRTGDKAEDTADPSGSDDTGEPAPTDADADGWPVGEDCDDTDAGVNPGQVEVPYDGVDNDCDEATPDDDLDGDGYLAAVDCDDGDALVFPGAVEVCNGRDDDCDGEVDDAAGDTWYADDDGDGYGDPDRSAQSCDGATGYVADATDCDDSRADVHPGAAEVCDGADDDCDGEVDEDVEDVYFLDEDGDGWGVEDATVTGCDTPAGYADQAGDCDDAEAAVNPLATEICDGVDNDCDGTADEDDARDAGTWYADADGDGYGDAGADRSACEQPVGHTADDSDCDDGDAAVNPGAAEVCNGLDDDCNGWTDDEDPGLTDGATWYLDYDSDGYGGTRVKATACEQPEGYVADATDCDDKDEDAYPGNTEVCDGADNDCDGDVDEHAVDELAWYADDDGDGYGDAGRTEAACEAPSGYVADDTDCDDDDPDTWPGAPERCDGADNDCDGQDDTLGYWPFEAGAGTVAYDYGALGLDGEVVDATWTTAGYSGGALEFDGASAYVELDHAELEASQGLTISAWVSPDTLRASSWDSVVSRGADGSSRLGCCGDSYYLGYYQEFMSFYTDTDSTLDGLFDYGDYSGHPGVWHHLAATWDAATGERVIYVDGEETASDASGPATPYYDGTPTMIGRDTNSGSMVLPFDGLIDEVKIFGCAADADAIASDYMANWPF